METKEESKGKKNKWLRMIGYVIFALSMVLWLAVLIVPFLLEKEAAIAATAGLIIGGEITFYLSIALLGKQIWQKFKAFFIKKKMEEPTPEIAEENESDKIH